MVLRLGGDRDRTRRGGNCPLDIQYRKRVPLALRGPTSAERDCSNFCSKMLGLVQAGERDPIMIRIQAVHQMRQPK